MAFWKTVLMKMKSDLKNNEKSSNRLNGSTTILMKKKPWLSMIFLNNYKKKLRYTACPREGGEWLLFIPLYEAEGFL